MKIAAIVGELHTRPEANTERPITVTRGTNRIIGVDPAALYTHRRRAADGQ